MTAGALDAHAKWLAAAQAAGGVLEHPRFLGCTHYFAWFSVAGPDSHFAATCMIELDGTMQRCTIIEMSALAPRAAQATLASCRWKPGRLNGNPVALAVTLKITKDMEEH